MKTTKKKASAKETAKEPKKGAENHEPAVGNIEIYKAKLEELRDQLNAAIRKKKEEVIPEAEVGDEGDVAMRSLSRDLVFEVTDNEHRLLEEVEAALRRIEKGTYGICEANGEKIAIARLKAIPYARYCINCQGRFERA